MMESSAPIMSTMESLPSLLFSRHKTNIEETEKENVSFSLYTDKIDTKRHTKIEREGERQIKKEKDEYRKHEVEINDKAPFWSV